jgi:indole-3-glycerol phosphate synthase
MARCSIAGLSVVTESESFGGSLDLLKEITSAVEVPVLQKDFILTRKQIEQSRERGASSILLIAGMLEDATLINLQGFSHTLGLETVVEVHTERELQRVMTLCLHMDLLGINNRDITVLETDDSDVTVTEEILRRGTQMRARKASVPVAGRDVMILSESSLQGIEDVRRAFEAGADGVLIGTAVMKAHDTERFLWELIRGGARDDRGEGLRDNV